MRVKLFLSLPLPILPFCKKRITGSHVESFKSKYLVCREPNRAFLTTNWSREEIKHSPIFWEIELQDFSLRGRVGLEDFRAGRARNENQKYRHISVFFGAEGAKNVLDLLSTRYFDLVFVHRGGRVELLDFGPREKEFELQGFRRTLI